LQSGIAVLYAFAVLETNSPAVCSRPRVLRARAAAFCIARKKPHWMIQLPAWRCLCNAIGPI